MKDRIFKMVLLTPLTKALHSEDDINKGRRVPHKKRLFVIKLDLKRKGGDATSEISTPIFC